MFYEIVIAPEYTPEGLATLQGKSKTLRILQAAPRAPAGRSLRQVAAGWLYQVRCPTPQHVGKREREEMRVCYNGGTASRPAWPAR